MKRLSTTTALLAALWGTAWALPQGGQVVGGNATITQPDAATLNINQTTNRAIIDWHGFDIGTGEGVYFTLPSANGVTLNRVYGGNASQIHGNLVSNGQLFLINPQGIVFGAGSQVNVGSLLATTATLNGNFMDGGPLSFGNGSGSIINQGTITAAPGGHVTLAAPTVGNEGTIEATRGTVNLAGANAFTLDPHGDGLLTLSPNPMAFAAHVANSGRLTANGGTVNLATQATQAAYAGVVNAGGMVEAHGFENVNGVIRLGGANTHTTNVTGVLAANGTDATNTGGTIQVLGNFVDIKTGARLEADGPAGGGTINVGGNVRGQGPLANATNTRVQSGATLSANATHHGDGGTIVVWGNNRTIFNGHASAQGGAQGGNGGFIEVSGRNSLSFNGTANTLAPNGHVGMLLLDPANIIVVNGAMGADDAEIADGEALEADGGGSDFIIAEQALEALAAGTNILLEATNDITIQNLADNELSLASTGSVVFRADSDGDGTGNFTMDAGDTIATGGGTLSIHGANVSLGRLETADGTGGHITVDTTTGSGNVSIAQGLHTTGGNITVNGNSTITGNTAFETGLLNGNIALNGALNGDHALTLNAGGGTVSVRGLNVDTLTLTAGGTTLNGTIQTDSAVSFANAGNITLAGNSAVQAQDGAVNHAITFGGNSINGAYSLGLTGSDITLGPVGNNAALTNLTLSASGAAAVGNVTTSGGQTYLAAGGLSTNGILQADGNLALTGAVTLAGNSTFASTGGNVVVDNAIDGPHTLSVNASGDATLASAVGGATPLAALAVNGTNVTMGNNATTTGNQTYAGNSSFNGTYTSTGGNFSQTGAATLAGNTQVNTAAGNGTIGFGGTVNGAHTLALNSGAGATTLSGAVGGLTPLASLSSNGPTTVADVTTAGAQTYTGPLSLNGTLTSNNGAVTVANTLALTGNGAISTGGGAGHDITLGGAVTGPFTLLLTAGAADVHLGTVNVGTLSIASANGLFMGGNITTTGTQDYTNTNTLTLLTALALNAGGGNIVMDAGNTLTGAYALTLTGNTVTLGQVNGLTALTVNPVTAAILANTVNTTGTQTYNGATQLATTLTSDAGNILFNGTVVLGANSTLQATAGNITLASALNGGHTLNATAGNTLAFNGPVGNLSPLANLALNATTLSMNTFAVTGNFASTHTNATFNGTGQASNIALTGASTFGAPITAVNDFSQNGNSTLNGNLNAGGNLALNGALTLNGDSTLTSGGGAAHTLTVTGNVAGDHNLILAAGAGDIHLGGNFDINGLTFASGNNLHYAGGTIEADTGIDFTPLSTILLGGNTNFIGRDGAGRGHITTSAANIILATVPDVDFYVYGDTVTMNQIGDAGAGRLGTLTVDANIAALLGSIYTSGGQTITAQEGLAGFLTSAGGDIILNTTANLVGNIDVRTNGGSIYIMQPLNGGYAMRLDASDGNVYINAALGNITPLTTMDIIANIIELTSPITTTGDQNYTGHTNLNTALTMTFGNITYNSPVTLTGNTMLDTSGGNGTITFNDTIDGAYNLNLRAGSLGDIVFNDRVGATQRLGDLTIESTGNITFTQGAFATNYFQRRIDGLASFGYTPGMDVTGSIDIAVSTALTGRFTGRDIFLDAGDYIEGEVFAENSLTLTSQRSMLTGTLRRQSGRSAARNVQFGHFYGGPHYFNGYNLPVVDDFYALPNLVAQAFALERPMPRASQVAPPALFIAPPLRHTSETAAITAPGNAIATVKP